MRVKQTPNKKASSAANLPVKSRSALSPVVEQRLRELAAFKQEHGHCNVPNKYPPNQSLAIWVQNVRRREKARKRDSELARRLDQLGFSWALRRRSARRLDWDAMVAALTAFKKQHGHWQVPQEVPEYRQLGLWVAKVRKERRRGLLNRRRIRQLDKLGFAWDPKALKALRWEEMYSALLRYRAKHGNCRVTCECREYPGLRYWVRNQRTARKNHRLKPADIERLDSIGFVWKRDLQELWDSHYAALAAFKKKHGHCNVSMLWNEHASLGNWVRTQRVRRRRGKLTERQIRRLDELGFLWEMPPGGMKSPRN
jgi:hypothetical protein